jgi:hypothetical protein
MNANSLNTESEFGNAVSVAELRTTTRPDLAATIGEYFLRLVVVALGIALGAILAEIIGLATGWIQLTC